MPGPCMCCRQNPFRRPLLPDDGRNWAGPVCFGRTPSDSGSGTSSSAEKSLIVYRPEETSLCGGDFLPRPAAKT